MIDFGTNRNWYWEAGLAEVRFQALDDGVPVLCRIGKSWIEENLNVTGDEDAEYLVAATNAFELICDEIRLRYSQDQRQPDGSVLLKGNYEN
ncbi:MAG: DUF1488 family protein [Rhodospirillales bacterium]|nr:DUF1488 family protein [Rhodospirillales bacterium]